MDSTNTVSMPKVSVLILTYNHERYIAQAVESALSQKTSFPIEIVIGEDCSTDHTRDILLEFERSHPETIRLLLHAQNIGPQANYAAAFAACRGEYIAILEGDDYWTNNKKLQKQVDALDTHPEWSMCFHITRRVYEDGSREPELYPLDWTKEEATIDDMLKGNFLNTCSQVFRNRLFGPLPSWFLQITPADWATNLLNADRGLIGCVPEVMADYRIHSQGIWTGKGRAFQLQEILKMLSHLDHHFEGKYRKPIDEYRINLVNNLVGEVEFLNNQLSHVLAIPTIVSPTPEVVLGESHIDCSEPSTNIEIPLSKNRSSITEGVRKIMRPIEDKVRHARNFVSKNTLGN